MLLEPFSSVSAQTVLETYTYTYGVKGGSERLRTPPPPRWPPSPPRCCPPTQCCPQCTTPPPPPVASYWRSQPLAGRLRAIRPTLVGFVVLNVFPNAFIVHSRPSFLFELSFHFSLVVFCSHADSWHWFFVFVIWFFKKRFSPITHSPF